MKLKYLIFLFISLFYFNELMADEPESPIIMYDTHYDYTIKQGQNKEFYSFGTFSISFDILDADFCLIDFRGCPDSHIIVRYIVYRDEQNNLFKLSLDEVYDNANLIITYFFNNGESGKRLDDYPIYVKDYLYPEDYKLIYGDSGVTGIDDDDDGVSIIKTGDDIVVRSTDSDIQEIRGCDMTGRNILSLPLSTDSSEIMIDRNRLCHGLNILSVFRRGQPTKSFKIMN